GELKFGIWWIDCGTFTIDSIKVYTDASTPAVTTAPSTTTTKQTTVATTAAPSGNGAYEIKPNEKIDYSALPKDDKMIGWEWAEFGIPATAKVKKVEINISTTADKIGKWQGAFGSSTKVSPDYWTQTEEMEQTISGKTGTITWNVDSATADIIQYNYGGELKFGIWWIDCGTFTIDSIKVYTDASTPAVTTAPATTTTTKPNTTTTTTTTKDDQPVLPSASLKGDATNNGEVDVRDVTAVAQHIVKMQTLSGTGLANADINNDGAVDVKDISQIKKFLIGAINKL
ncbi:MAG: DUF5620 domain-containing protein, partial [Oscillospiraceae bacterium]